MKKTMLCCSCLIVLIFSTFTVLAGQQKIVVANVNKEVYPFILQDGANNAPNNPGVTIEMLDILAQRLDLTITHIRLPWKRVLYQLRHGDVDVTIASFKPERLNDGVYPMVNGEVDQSKRSGTNNYVLYTLKGSKITWDNKQKIISNVQGAIGASRGYSIVSDLKSWGVTVEEAEHPVSNLEKLLLGRIAGLADHEYTIDAIISKNPEKYKLVQKLGPALEYKPYYLFFSKQFFSKHPELAAKMWVELAKIREQEFVKLKQKYFKLVNDEGK